ncbi:MAG: YibE/F family protein, partial [Lachnospiraceae bacterium]|nr:YibE/F family protein [Lachnospiraceae bacterium]
MSERKRNIISYVLVTVLSVAFIFVGAKMQDMNLMTHSEEFYTAEVTSLLDVTTSEVSLDSGVTTVSTKSVYFEAEIQSGEYEGQKMEMLQTIDYMYSIQPKTVEVGDKIIVSYAMDPITSESCFMFIEYNRIPSIVILCLVFFALLLFIARGKGLGTIISLVFTAAAVFLVYVPAILSGRNIYTMSIIISIFIIFMSLIFINGVNTKTLCAILGNLGGVAVAGFLAYFVSEKLRITGAIDEDCLFLMYVNEEHPIDLKAIVWGSIVIGSLGAVMDVAMSIASAMKELADNMEAKTSGKLIRSGMNIGKDAIGTMTNTLILAYIGSSLATVLLLVASNKDPISLFNMEMILVEIMQGVVGSIGILFAV